MAGKIKEFFVNILPGPIVRLFARPYVAGLGMEAGLKTARKIYEEEGVYTTLDLLGEAVYSRELVERNVRYYKQLLDLINKENAQKFATVSLKLSSLGIHESKEYCVQNLEEILNHADKYGIPITIDMEDSNFTDVTLEIYRELLPKHPTLGTVLQTMLFRTEKDVKEFPDHSRVRLVIGIYKEPPEIAYQDKKIMHQKMLEYAKQLLERDIYIEFGTHNEKTIREMLAYLKKTPPKGKPHNERFEFQMLLGVPRDKIVKEIQQEGYIVRKYVPFAMDWEDGTAYLKRRMLENDHLMWYVLKNLLSNKWIQTLIAIIGIGVIGWLLYYFNVFKF